MSKSKFTRDDILLLENLLQKEIDKTVNDITNFMFIYKKASKIRLLELRKLLQKIKSLQNDNACNL